MVATGPGGFGVVTAAPETEFLTGPGDETDRPREGPGRRQKSGTLNNDGHARTIVVGARCWMCHPVPTSRFFADTSQIRLAAAAADGVVMRADDVRAGIRIGAGQFADDVVHEGVLRRDAEAVEMYGVFSQFSGQSLAQVRRAFEGFAPPGVAAAHIATDGAEGGIDEGQALDGGAQAICVDLFQQRDHGCRRLPSGRAQGRRQRRCDIVRRQGIEEMFLLEQRRQTFRLQTHQSPATWILIDEVYVRWPCIMQVIDQVPALIAGCLVCEEDLEAGFYQLSRCPVRCTDDRHAGCHIAQRLECGQFSS